MDRGFTRLEYTVQTLTIIAISAVPFLAACWAVTR